MRAIKAGRDAINLGSYACCVFLHYRFKYATETAIAIGLICLGVLNTYALSSTGHNVTITGKASELIGSENTTIAFIFSLFVNGNVTFNVMILSPIYLLINIAMLVSVYDEATQENTRKVQTINIIMRFALIALACNFFQSLIALQEAELFYEKHFIKMQQK